LQVFQQEQVLTYKYYQRMGLFLSRLAEVLSAWNEGTPARIVMLGLDGAGI
jgi:hypothetical protein